MDSTALIYIFIFFVAVHQFEATLLTAFALAANLAMIWWFTKYR